MCLSEKETREDCHLLTRNRPIPFAGDLFFFFFLSRVRQTSRVCKSRQRGTKYGLEDFHQKSNDVYRKSFYDLRQAPVQSAHLVSIKFQIDPYKDDTHASFRGFVVDVMIGLQFVFSSHCLNLFFSIIPEASILRPLSSSQV